MTRSPNADPQAGRLLSVVIPIYNERDNIPPLVEHVVECVRPLGCAYELILVNDGSTDGSTEALDAAAAADPRIKVIHFTRNFGQTAAMAAGFDAAQGDVIITLDGDRQNEPADIPALLARLDEGFDLVSGWRRNRQDNALRRLPSRLANRLIGRVTGVRLHDYGCTLKAYRRGAIDAGELYGEMHRFLPVYVAMRGGRITEMVVRHHPRTAGVSKYGIGRTFRVCVDLLLIHLLYKYAARPSHLFVRAATWAGAAAGVLAVAGVVAVFIPGVRLWGGLAWLGAIATAAAGSTFVATGLCAELVMRTRHAARRTRAWDVRRTVNMAPPAVRSDRDVAADAEASAAAGAAVRSATGPDASAGAKSSANTARQTTGVR